MPPTLRRPATLPALALAVALGLLLPVTLPSAAAGAETCTDTPTPGYTVRVCLVAPDAGAVLTGEATVTARVEFVAASVTPPTVSKVIFGFRGGYLLTDHDAEPATGMFGMTWRTSRMIDGTGPFEVKARLSDDVVALHTVDLTVANGVTTPPTNTAQFGVRHGTTPPDGRRFRLAAVGDAAAGSPSEQKLAAQIASWSPNLLTYLGDVYERGSVHEFDNWYAPGTGGFGQFRDITNPTVGNHEYLTKDAAGYFDYWDNVPHYYSYDVAGWHIATIDSSDDYNQLVPGTPQYDWLAADLGANRAHCTIVTMHHPRYSLAEGGGRTGLSQVWALLAARRVTLAIGGHAHHYERWVPLNGSGSPDPRGVTELVAGAGGHELTPPVLADPRAVTSVSELGALRLDLGAEDVSFAYVNGDGVERDGGTIGCKSTGDPLPPSVPTGLLVSPSAATTAQLSWNPSTDQYASVAGYTVRRNGVVIATLGPTTTSYTDSGLTSGETYSWTVSAFDTSDNHSAQSRPASTTMPSPSVQQVSARTLLRALPVRPETGRGYRRTKFRTWVDVDGDQCNTRDEVLLAEAKKPPTLLPACRITGGRWVSPYDGVATDNRKALGIGHLVPLLEAWQSGARGWTAATRTRFANDLTYRPTLGVSTERILRARGSAEPHRWLPPRVSTRCSYVAQWVAVKWRWRLGVDRAEKRFLTRRLRACDWPRVEQPVRASISRR